jgi:trigger factor
VQPEPVGVTDKDVDNVLENLRHQSATYEPVDRPVKLGDILTIDIEGTVMETPIFKGKGAQHIVQPEYPPEIPGLSEHFIGMKKDEAKEFKHKLPEDYANKTLAGKEVSFKVKVLEIKEEKLPELDDNFAMMIAPDVKTLDMLRERIAKNMEVDFEQKSKTKFEEKLVETVIEKSKLEIPPLMIESEAEFLLQEGLQQLQASCKSKEEYENKLKQLSMKQVREEYRSVANKRILWNLVLREIAKKENIEVSDSEIDEEIESMIQGATDKEREEQRQFLNEPMNRENVRAMVGARKTIELLTKIAITPEDTTSPEKKTRKKKEKEAK